MGVHRSLSKPEPTGLRSEPLRATKSGRLVTSDVVTVRSDHISLALRFGCRFAQIRSHLTYTPSAFRSFVASFSYAACSLFHVFWYHLVSLFSRPLSLCYRLFTPFLMSPRGNVVYLSVNYIQVLLFHLSIFLSSQRGRIVFGCLPELYYIAKLVVFMITNH